jgi:uncharacterized membrane protein YbhN (UPF0104 family)
MQKTFISIAIEALTILAASLIVLMITLMIGIDVERSYIRIESYAPLYCAFIFGIAMVLAFHVYKKNYFATYVGNISYKFLLLPLLCYFINFIISGLSIYLILNILWDDKLSLGLWQLIWKYTIASVLGFLIPGVPGGVGVREAAMISLLAPEAGIGNAAILAAATRLVTTSSEILFFFSGWLVGEKKLCPRVECDKS